MKFSLTTLITVFLASTIAHSQDELTIPPPKTLTFRTKDFVRIQATYYAGGFRKSGDKVEEVPGKEVVPVILLHGWGQKSPGLEFPGQGPSGTWTCGDCARFTWTWSIDKAGRLGRQRAGD